MSSTPQPKGYGMHPKNPPGPIVNARALGPAKVAIFSLQHVFAMFGATIIVPIIVNASFQAATGEPITVGPTVAVALLFAGLGTLLFHLVTGGKIPAFLGSSFAYLGGFAAVANLNTGKFAGMGANEKVSYACGGVVVAGAMYLVLALLIKLVGAKRVMRFLPPVVTGPIIICIGLGLAPSAIDNCKTNWWLALLAIAVVIVFNIFGKGMAKTIPVLLGVVITYIVAAICHGCGLTNPDGSAILNTANIAQASIIGAPKLGICRFDPTACIIMACISIASMMEHVGDISAISATTGKNFIEKPGLHRTLIGDGLATSIAGFFLGLPNTTYGENTAVLQLSGVHDPFVVEIAAGIAAVMSFSPKISAVIATMPSSIIGGISFVLYGMIAGVGARNLIENATDLKKSRNIIIVGVTMVCGLGITSGATFTIGGTTITLTAIAIASIVGITLNAIFPGKDYEFGVSQTGDENRGLHF